MAIEFTSQNEFVLDNKDQHIHWLTKVVSRENKSLGEISYVFCTDEYLHQINLEYLNHDTLTDIITFDYTIGEELHAEIYISTDRISDNASLYDVAFHTELIRVMVHGVLHLCGYRDKSAEESQLMRSKEDVYIALFNS